MLVTLIVCWDHVRKAVQLAATPNTDSTPDWSQSQNPYASDTIVRRAECIHKFFCFIKSSSRGF